MIIDTKFSSVEISLPDPKKEGEKIPVYCSGPNLLYVSGKNLYKWATGKGTPVAPGFEITVESELVSSISFEFPFIHKDFRWKHSK